MIRDFIAIDFEMSQRALSQRAWHRVMGEVHLLHPCIQPAQNCAR